MIEGLVGPLEQLVGAFTVLRHGGPDADPDRDLLPGVAHDRAGHQDADPLPQLSQLRVVDGVREDDELLASPASREVPDADATAMVEATVRSAASPASWPCWSFTALK